MINLAKVMRGWIMVGAAWAGLTAPAAHAFDPEQVIKDARSIGTTNSSAVDSIKSKKATDTTPNYQQTLPAADAYAKDPTTAYSAQQAACAKTPNDPACVASSTATLKRNPVYIRLDDPMLASKSAASNPESILGNFTTTYNACTTTSPTLAKAAQYQTKNCSLIYNNRSSVTCDKKFTTVTENQYTCTPGTWFASQVLGGGKDKMTVEVLCEPTRTDGMMTFRLNAYGGKGQCVGAQTVTIDMAHPTNDNGTTNQVTTLSPHWQGYCQDLPVYQVGPGCQNGKCSKTFNFVQWQPIYDDNGDFTGQYSPVWRGQIIFGFDQPNLVRSPGDYIDSTCTPYEQLVPNGALPPDGVNTPPSQINLPFTSLGMPRQCLRTSSKCIDGPSTKTFGGKQYYRSCWEYTNTFSCADLDASSTCKSPDMGNCAQVAASSCKSMDPATGTCNEASVPLQCPTADAQYSTAVNCGNASFCSGGSCYDANSVPNTDFAKSYAYLEAASEAAKDLDVTNMRIFTGKELRCKNMLLNTTDCCDSKTIFDGVLGGGGASQVLMLACLKSQQETIELAQKREQGQCHKNWDWTSYIKVGGSLTGIKVPNQTTESYCCFNSKLGRIINEQGRPQIGKTWGDESNHIADCSGFTVDELQKLDFSAMDFSEIYADIKVNMPDPTASMGKASGTVPNCYYGSGKCQ